MEQQAAMAWLLHHLVFLSVLVFDQHEMQQLQDSMSAFNIGKNIALTSMLLRQSFCCLSSEVLHVVVCNGCCCPQHVHQIYEVVLMPTMCCSVLQQSKMLTQMSSSQYLAICLSRV